MELTQPVDPNGWVTACVRVESDHLIFGNCHGRTLTVGHSISSERGPVVLVSGMVFTDLEARVLVTAINDRGRLITDPMLLEAHAQRPLCPLRID